jgi:hypothetical protein
MKKITGLAAAVLVCSLAATAFAGNDSKKLLSVGVTDNNQAILWPAGGSWSGNECASRAVVIIDTSTDSGRLMYQTVLAAYLAGHTVRAYWSGSPTTSPAPSQCIGSYPRVTRIEVSP